MTMSGMMTAEQMKALAEARGEAFDSEWLTMMIAHHEGAVAMAEQVKQTSDDPQVVALADSIITAQQTEIAQMEAYLSESR